jgi:hypothetical protein
MDERYRGKKTKNLHLTVGFWHYNDDYGTCYLDSTSKYEDLTGSYIYFDTDRYGLRKLSEEGFNIQEKKITWHDIPAVKEITDHDHQPYNEFRVFIDNFSKNCGLRLRFTQDFFEVELSERNLTKIFQNKNKYVEFHSEESIVINKLIKKGYKIQRAKVSWRPISSSKRK